MNNKPHYIYGLVDPNTDEIRYIGRSVNPKARQSVHMGHNGGINQDKREWAKSLKSQGKTADIIILEVCTDHDDASEAESVWINYFLASGPLFNRIYRGCKGMNKGAVYGRSGRSRRK